MTIVPRPNTLLTPPDLHPEMELVMRVMPMPEDANGNGDIFGGWIMAKIDLGGCVLPARVAKGDIGHGSGQRVRVPSASVGGRPAVDLRPRGKGGQHLP